MAWRIEHISYLVPCTPVTINHNLTVIAYSYSPVAERFLRCSGRRYSSGLRPPQAERGMLPAAFAKRGPHGVSTLSIVASATGVAFLGLLGFEAIVEILNFLCESLTMYEICRERGKFGINSSMSCSMCMRQGAASSDSHFRLLDGCLCSSTRWLETCKRLRAGALPTTIVAHDGLGICLSLAYRISTADELVTPTSQLRENRGVESG